MDFPRYSADFILNLIIFFWAWQLSALLYQKISKIVRTTRLNYISNCRLLLEKWHFVRQTQRKQEHL